MISTKMIGHARLLLGCIVGGYLIWGIVTGAIIRDRKPISHYTNNTDKTKITGETFFVDQLISLTGVLVSSPKESFEWRKSMIASTTGHLDFWIYDITYNRAKLSLVQLAESKIPMRIILENKKYSSFGNSYIGAKALLEDAGAKVMSDSDLNLGTNFVHAKTFVTPQWTIIQTANLTNGGFNKSREYYMQLTNSGVVANIQALFDADWKGKPLEASQIHPNILVCPVNCRSKIQSLIRGAKSSILIQNQYIEDPGLARILSRSKTAKQIIIASNDFSTDTLALFGDQARVLTNPYPHAKMMLIDDKYLVVSSINFSTNSMDNNREIGVIVTNRDAIDVFKTRFAQDRNKSKTRSSFKRNNTGSQK